MMAAIMIRNRGFMGSSLGHDDVCRPDTLLWYPAGLKISVSTCVSPSRLVALARIVWVPAASAV